MLKINMGTLDRDARLALTLLFLLMALFVDQPVIQVLAAVLGAIMFVTAATAVCPLYALLNISTVRK